MPSWNGGSHHGCEKVPNFIRKLKDICSLGSRRGDIFVMERPGTTKELGFQVFTIHPKQMLAMEASAKFALSQLPFVYPAKPSSSRAYPFWPCKRRSSQPTRLHCNKMYVAGFGEASPETKAAKNLHNFFTYVAVRIVSAQLESYNPEAYKELMEFLDRHSLNDGDKFCASLMRESSRHKNLALRIMEVRSAYCKQDFEWDNLKRLAFKMVNDSNTKLMREYVTETTQ